MVRKIPQPVKIEAVLVSEDQDSTDVMGKASGNAIDPPWDTYALDEFMIEIDEGSILELDDRLGDTLEVDEEYTAGVKRVGNKIRIYFGVMGSKVLQHTGATYEHLPG
jgi:hypothetical protein